MRCAPQARAGRVPKFADGGAVMSTSRAAQYAARPALSTGSPIVHVSAPASDLAPLQDSIAALGADIRGLRLRVDGRDFGRIVSTHQTRSRENGGE